MNQHNNNQQNKHRSKNYKKGTPPAKLLKKDYVGITERGDLCASFDTEEEMNKYLLTFPETTFYLIKTYRLNNQQITTQQKVNKED